MKVDINFNEEIQTLKTKRDELKLQTHLMKAEATDEFEKAEEKWSEFQQKVKHIQNSAENSGENIKEAAVLLLGELKNAYERVKQGLK